MQGTSFQRVVAVVVCHNGRPFIRETLRGLSRQSRPIDDLVVVDTGSRDGTLEWLSAHLAPDQVLSTRGSFGRAVMTAMGSQRVASADWLWLLHDDACPERDALRRLLEEAEYTPSATVLGPKLVGWDDPEQLQEVGFWVDRAGYAVSPVEEREIDQGQYDGLSEVFFVNTAGMLIQRQQFLAAGGFDPRMTVFRDDLDLCWRAHLTGGKVMIVPQAKVRHFRAASVGSRIGNAGGFKRYYIERHTLAAILKNVELRRLPIVLLSYFLATLIRVIGLTGSGRVGEAGQALLACGWNLKALPGTLRQRWRVQRARKVPDKSLARLRAPQGHRLRSTVRALTEFLVSDPGGTHAQQLTFGEVVKRLMTRHPAATALIGFSLLTAIALRSVLLSPRVGGGAMPPFPASATDLFSGFVSSVGTDGLGSTLPASPSLLVFGLAAALAFGSGVLAQKLLLWLVLPLAAGTCMRALRVVVPDERARIVAGVLYASTPLATAALAQGRIGELAFLVLAPPALAQIWLALRLDQPREPWRPALRFALLTAVAVAMFPPALVVLAVAVVAATLFAVFITPRSPAPEPDAAAGGRGRAAQAAAAAVRAGIGGARMARLRRAVLLVAGLGAALALLAPWSLLLFGESSPLRGQGEPLLRPSFVELLQLRPGGSGQAPFIGPLYPLLALAAVVMAGSIRRLTAFGLGLAIIASALLATWQANGLPPYLTNWPGGVLIPGAVAWAALVGLGVTGLIPALKRPPRQLPAPGMGRLAAARASAPGPRRLAALGLAGVTAASLAWVAVSMVIHTYDLTGGNRLPSTVTEKQGGILWLASKPDGSLEYTVTGPDGPTMVGAARPVPSSADDALRRIVLDIAQSRTHRAGTLLRELNVGFVIVRQSPGNGDDRIVSLLTRQGDLEPRITNEAGLFEGPPPAPAGIVVPGEPPERAEQLLAQPEQPAALKGGLPEGSGTVRGPGTLILPMPSDGSWTATLAGQRLEPVTAFGWAQAFQVPEGVEGEVDVSYTGQRARTLSLLAELSLLFIALGLLSRPSRRPAPVVPVSDEDTGELRLPSVGAPVEAPTGERERIPVAAGQASGGQGMAAFGGGQPPTAARGGAGTASTGPIPAINGTPPTLGRAARAGIPPEGAAAASAPHAYGDPARSGQQPGQPAPGYGQGAGGFGQRPGQAPRAGQAGSRPGGQGQFGQSQPGYGAGYGRQGRPGQPGQPGQPGLAGQQPGQPGQYPPGQQQYGQPGYGQRHAPGGQPAFGRPDTGHSGRPGQRPGQPGSGQQPGQPAPGYGQGAGGFGQRPGQAPGAGQAGSRPGGQGQFGQSQPGYGAGYGRQGRPGQPGQPGQPGLAGQQPGQPGYGDPSAARGGRPGQQPGQPAPGYGQGAGGFGQRPGQAPRAGQAGSRPGGQGQFGQSQPGYGAGYGRQGRPGQPGQPGQPGLAGQQPGQPGQYPPGQQQYGQPGYGQRHAPGGQPIDDVFAPRPGARRRLPLDDADDEDGRGGRGRGPEGGHRR